MEHITYFPADPEELFEIQYIKKTGFSNWIIWGLSISSLKTKEVNLPLFNWDLNDYASTIKIEIEEVDLTVTTQTSESRQVKFATNFAIDGLLKKIGLKFGG